MKQKFLNSLTKDQLRTIASNLQFEKVDKLNRDKLIDMLSKESYSDLVKSLPDN